MEDTNLYGNLEVGEGVVIKGDCDVPGRVVIAGEWIGKIKAEALEVARGGLVDGEIHAAQMDIRGILRNQVHCSGFLIIRQSALVDGHVHYSEVEVEKGGVMTGQLHKTKT